MIEVLWFFFGVPVFWLLWLGVNYVEHDVWIGPITPMVLLGCFFGAALWPFTAIAAIMAWGFVLIKLSLKFFAHPFWRTPLF